MIFLVLGSPDSGKSEKAESLVMEISGDGKRYYIATMIPFGEEGKKRVAKHRAMREGKGFVTIEYPVRVHEIITRIDDPDESTCLLECMSNLVGNEMHETSYAEDPRLLATDKDVLKTSDKAGLLGENSTEGEEELVDYIIGSVMKLAEQVRNLVIVANSFPMEDEGYDDETKRYVRVTERVNEELMKRVDKVYEISA